ncbi:DUF6000 family protein [Flavobacterium sp. MFBS3-15]|uniref:DUF6000 family protein n=1 Tax=Flavobacterium sp. MFBS3-15 TaxID=2989816 RepID=UPI0022367DC1|nr:DUF6000 family protein [Flavobacterium sp. MFBS3-15]MCW4469269.1 DUF6000 family protein [Flavobacterium sp. MFBS3-15]
MVNNDLEKLKAHVAGATVVHTTPFADMISFKNDAELTQEFIDKWIIPYYMNLERTDDDWISQICDLKPTITKDVIENCLGDFNWRTRQVGAYFAAITNRPEFIDIIGVHLLKSEVCYAGTMYAKVMAYFNTPGSVGYLNTYLDYYLKQPDLWFDQQDVLTAIAYLDKQNGTANFNKHSENWEKFIENKPYWKKEIETAQFEKQIAAMIMIHKN